MIEWMYQVQNVNICGEKDTEPFNLFFRMMSLARVAQLAAKYEVTTLASETQCVFTSILPHLSPEWLVHIADSVISKAPETERLRSIVLKRVWDCLGDIVNDENARNVLLSLKRVL